MNNSLYTAMLHLHSFGRWIVLLLLVIAIFRSLSAGNDNFTRRDQRIGLLLTIFADIMLLVGLYLYFAGPWGYQQIQNNGMDGAMKNPVSRFFAMEHLIGMLIAIVLMHIGKAQGKKDLPHRTKHRRTATFYIIALLAILVSIPWPFRFADRGWF
jgi:hypothetical protein